MKRNLNTLFACLTALVLILSGVLTAAAETAEEANFAIPTTQAFSEQAVSKENLTTIAQAGMSAASAINQQPWHFVVVTNPEIIAQLSSSGGFAPGAMPEGMSMPEGMPDGAPTNMPGAPEGGFGEGNAMPPFGGEGGMPAMPAGGSAKAGMGDSPAVIILYMNENTASPNAAFDCGLACQNMVVAADALGISTKIISSPTSSLNGENHDTFCQLLGVEPAMKAVAVVLVGYADETVEASSGATTRAVLEEKVSFVE